MNTNPQPFQTSSRHVQRGVASLFVAMTLLLGGTIIAFFANRSFVFEQRTSANQYRATKAFELAEAGTEWALGKFNENAPLVAGTSCAVGGAPTDPSFRDRYATPAAGVLTVDTSRLHRCRVDQAGLATCDCQATVGAFAVLGAADSDQGYFGVRFRPVAPDSSAVEIVARGCVQGDATCDPLGASSPAAATAVVRIVAKVLPTMRAGPAAPLTAGSVTATGGTLQVVNTDAPSNGITIHSGAAVAMGSRIVALSLPGSPSSASIIEGDVSLTGITPAAEDARFANYFGQTLSNYRNVDADVIRITGCAASACGTQVMNVINSGARNLTFFVNGDVSFDVANVAGGTIGSASNPVVVVADGALAMSGSITAQGFFYAAAARFDGTGTSTLRGAVVTRGNVENLGGTTRLIYDPSVWGAARPPIGRMVRVPGSWRDKFSDY